MKDLLIIIRIFIVSNIIFTYLWWKRGNTPFFKIGIGLTIYNIIVYMLIYFYLRGDIFI